MAEEGRTRKSRRCERKGRKEKGWKKEGKL